MAMFIKFEKDCLLKSVWERILEKCFNCIVKYTRGLKIWLPTTNIENSKFKKCPEIFERQCKVSSFRQFPETKNFDL